MNGTLSQDLTMVIYVITHVASGRRYVGQTTKKSKHRWREHCNAGRGTKDQTYKEHSMYITNAMRKYGVEAFMFEAIEQCDSPEELNKRESFWIQELETLSPNGFNLRSGPIGVVGVKIASSVGRKISKANKGRVKGPEWRAALSRSHTGKKMSAETCQKIAEVQRGKKRGPCSEEVKAKISSALKGRSFTEERKVAVRVGMARMTDVAKLQMVSSNSLARTGKKLGPQNEEHRAKIGAAHRGRTHTAETKARISKAQLGKKRGPYSEERKVAARLGLLKTLVNDFTISEKARIRIASEIQKLEV